MTYKEQLDGLLHACIEKFDAYVEAVSTRGQNSPEVLPYRTAWEHAESAYNSCLNLIRTRAVSPHDPVDDDASSHAAHSDRKQDID